MDFSKEGRLSVISRKDKMRHWKVRDGIQTDLEGILSLRRIVFGEMEKDKLDDRFWNWEFREGPDGKAFVYVVEDEHKIIGHFADIPRRFYVQGEVVLGTLSVDLMVHPDYRRKGIFEAMGTYGVRRVKQENGLFLFAFPIRPETIQGFKKLGWREVVELPVLVYPIRFVGIARRYLSSAALSHVFGGISRCFYFLLTGLKRRKGAEEVELEKMDSLDDQFDTFWEKASTSTFSPIMGVRNRNYLNWRYLQHPTRNYSIYRAKRNGEMKGYIVLRRVELLGFNSTVIVDLLALDEGILSVLVEQGIQHSQQEASDLVGFMVPKGHLYHKLLRKMGFLPSFKRFLFMVYPNSDEAIILAPEKWYVNWGDADVI
jgi:GNAT superfamily N-acetyltransferase